MCIYIYIHTHEHYIYIYILHIHSSNITCLTQVFFKSGE